MHILFSFVQLFNTQQSASSSDEFVLRRYQQNNISYILVDLHFWVDMLLSTALNVLALASSVIGDRSRCGPRDPHERLMQQHAAHEDENRQPHSAKFGNDRSYASSTSTSGSTNVNTYVHVVASLAEASDFNQQMVDDQVRRAHCIDIFQRNHC